MNFCCFVVAPKRKNSATPQYLQFAELLVLGGEVVQPGAALLNSDLCAVQPLLQGLSVGLKRRHLGLQALGMGHLSSFNKHLWKLTDFFFFFFGG